MARLYDEEVIEEFPIPMPEVVSRGTIDFGGAPPLPGGTMNAGVPNQVYGTPENNAWIAEQRALAGISPQQQRQKLLLNAEIEEQAIRTEGQLEYQQLVKGGALPEEAYRRVAGKLLWNHPDKLALALDRVSVPGVIPGSINSVPIQGEGGTRIGDAVYDAAGRLHATRFADPNRQTPEQKMGITIDKERRDQLAAELRSINRALNDPIGVVKPETLARKKELEAQLEGMRAKAMGAPEPQAPAPASTDKVIVVKDGKRFRLPKSQLDEAIKDGYTLSK